MARRVIFWGADSTSASDFDFDYSEDETDSSTTNVESEEKKALIDHRSSEEEEADPENAEPVRVIPRRSRCCCPLNDKWKRIWGLYGYLLLMGSTAETAWQIKSYTHSLHEQVFSILALLIVLITYSLLYYTESTCGKGMDLWIDPILCHTLQDIRGMWIANIGFGFAFSFSMIVQASSISNHRKVSLILWAMMGVSMGCVIYFKMDDHIIAHGTAVSFFVLLLVANLIVEVVWAPDSDGLWHSGGWFQVSLCMIIVSLLIPVVEEIIRSIYGTRSCNGGECRNQLYIHFSLLFYMMGIVVRAFS